MQALPSRKDEAFPDANFSATADLHPRPGGQDGGVPRIWCNGDWIDAEDFRIAAGDRGLLHGLGLFETLLAIDGRPVFADRHLARLQHGCLRLGWPLETAGLSVTMAELLEKNGLHTSRARIRLTLTAGSGKTGDIAPGADRLLWMASSAIPEAPESMAVCIAPFPRNEHSPLAGLKCASYAENLIALDHARRAGFEETLFFNTAGHLCEAATANAFLVKDGALSTPSLESGCLPGITRGVVLEIASSLGIPYRESPLAAVDLQSADGVFLTSSTRGPIAVSRLDSRELPPCALAATIRRAWHGAIEGENSNNQSVA
jgi:branched-subunit amino acid aminotransferase/4-amino-4-deoxychorismate lyase